MSDTLCPCGNQLDYWDCCGRYIENNELPETPEALMRSRYVAYTLNNMKYIVATMRGKALKKFQKSHAQNGSTDVNWEGLTVLSTFFKTQWVGYVTFEAHYNLNGQSGVVREKSEFQKIATKWFYVNGKQLPQA